MVIYMTQKSSNDRKQKALAGFIGDRVKRRRAELGLTQADLAKKSKSSITTINRLEKGKQVPQATTLDEISKALELDLSNTGARVMSVPAFKLFDSKEEEAEFRKAAQEAFFKEVKNKLAELDEIPAEIWEGLKKTNWDDENRYGIIKASIDLQLDPQDFAKEIARALAINPKKMRLFMLINDLPDDLVNRADIALRQVLPSAVNENKDRRRK